SNKVIQLILRDENGGAWETGPFYPNYVRQEVRAGKPDEPVTTTSTWQMPGTAVLLAADPADASAAAPAVKMDNYARRVTDRYDKPYYEWRVFVAEGPGVLQKIARVDYVL